MRLGILLIALGVASACAAPSPFTPSTGRWQFSGTVSRVERGQVGSPIAGAELSVVSGVNMNAKVTTDVSGRYLFTGLESGRFTVAVAARGYLSATPVVDLYRDTEANFALAPR